MEKTFKLQILSVSGKVAEADVTSLVAPTELGYVGILADHAPFLAKVTAGKIIFRDNSGKLTTLHSEAKGFLEVLRNKVAILLESMPGERHEKQERR